MGRGYVNPAASAGRFKGTVDDFLSSQPVHQGGWHVAILSDGVHKAAHHALAEEGQDAGVIGVVQRQARVDQFGLAPHPVDRGLQDAVGQDAGLSAVDQEAAASQRQMRVQGADAAGRNGAVGAAGEADAQHRVVVQRERNLGAGFGVEGVWSDGGQVGGYGGDRTGQVLGQVEHVAAQVAQDAAATAGWVVAPLHDRNVAQQASVEALGMDADELAQFAGLDHGGDSFDQGIPAQGEADAGAHAGRHGRHVHVAGLHGVEGDGLFDEDVLAGGDAGHGLRVVLVVR